MSLNFMSCQNEQMNTHMLKVHMTMIGSPIFAKHQVPLIMAQMVYVEVTLGV
jgi:hypothetical protein